MVQVTPATFTKVFFDGDEIGSVTTDLVERLGLDGAGDISIIVDEDQPTTRRAVAGLEPLIFHIDSGALENTRDPWTFSVEAAEVTIGALLIEASDRMDPDFSAPPLGEPTDLAHKVAWAVSCLGRLSGAGFGVARHRHLYDFRNRHGFSDHADAAFDQLWTSANPSWSDIVRISDAAAST